MIDFLLEHGDEADRSLVKVRAAALPRVGDFVVLDGSSVRVESVTHKVRRLPRGTDGAVVELVVVEVQ